MYHTPPQKKKMVNTRGTARKEGHLKDEAQLPVKRSEEVKLNVTNLHRPGTSGGSVKTESQDFANQVNVPPSQSHKSSRSKKSSYAILAQKKRLELEAAEQKARIQMELIDKRLEADLAAVEENNSPLNSEIESHSDGRDIEKWLQCSQQELEEEQNGANFHGQITSSQFPPSKEDGTEGPVQQLANALRDLVTISAPTSHNANLLSRISTPRELPLFAGDPMEWLSFKNAYEESTNVCNFSEKENLWRLRKCLRGSAKEAVSALLISTTSPEIVMSTLELQFGNPDIIISRILHEVKKLNPLSSEYYEDIINGSKQPTKREMLRVVMSIFDVYGLLSPITVIGKIIIQETWRANISWDDPVNDATYKKWYRWICLLEKVRDVRLPRHYPSATIKTSEIESETRYLPRPEHTTTYVGAPPHALENEYRSIATTASYYTQLQLHIFCDASTKAFCAVAYWRWIDDTSKVRVAFIASKCRVVGNKPITIPCLELQAAVLAVRLADSITKEHRMTADRRIFWSDSTTVLHWIRNNSRNYKVFIANRLGEIDELSRINEWRYVPTKLNVADIATRENYDCPVLPNEWLYGPTFLYKNFNDWPRDVIEPENKECNLECVTILQMDNKDLPVPEPSRFSSWIRLLRTTLRVLTFIDCGVRAICRKLEHRKFTYNVDDDIMERAERLLIIYAQNQSFSEEISLLKSCKRIPTSSKLLTLSPYLDEHGILRVDGRIDAARDVLPAMKRPIILDGQNYIARLIVKHYHIKFAHGNQETLVNEIKQKYWIVRLRPTIKNVAAKCMLCRLRKCKPEIPRIGDLPGARLSHHQRPFTYCGVDLFGPMKVTIGRRHENRYGVLFTCLTVRAVHIETVTTLTTDSFIMALRRMAARRGWPHHLYSDNGTNLRSADKELKKSILELDEEVMKNEASNHGTKWTFIPPVSPHWAGAWERLIRSVKTSLRIVLKERAPREETLSTLLAEVENIVNSRPLTHVSVDPESLEALTPNHFLIGTSSNLPMVGKFDDSDLFLRKQWRISQRLIDMFWKRWIREVLPELIPRKIWNNESRPLQVGDLVFIVDPDGPRNTWPKGVIQEVCPGRDGRVRMVKIRTKSGIFIRSAVRVARIPLAEECC